MGRHDRCFVRIGQVDVREHQGFAVGSDLVQLQGEGSLDVHLDLISLDPGGVGGVLSDLLHDHISGNLLVEGSIVEFNLIEKIMSTVFLDLIKEREADVNFETF